MESRPDIDKDERVRRLLNSFVREVVFVDLGFDDGSQERFIVNRDEALAIGITNTGDITHSVSNEGLQRLIELGFNPSLN